MPYWLVQVGEVLAAVSGTAARLVLASDVSHRSRSAATDLGAPIAEYTLACW
jgi:hypothetical protein